MPKVWIPVLMYCLTSEWKHGEIVDGQMSDLILLIGYLYCHRRFWQTKHIIRIRRGYYETGELVIESIPGKKVTVHNV